jgi:tRNA A-37 threonylcarbamoyl transferase component Bud32
VVNSTESSFDSSICESSTQHKTLDRLSKVKYSIMVIMEPGLYSKKFRVLYLLSIYFSLLVSSHGGSISFNFNFSDQTTVDENIMFKGDAFYDGTNKISLNLESTDKNNTNSTGRATYNQPVQLWDENTGEVMSFTTRFSFLIQNATPNNFGDGLAFFLSPYQSQIPPEAHGAEGKYLGLFNSTTAMNSSANQVVAVEFDTFFNSDIDPNSTNPTDCHIGIDVNMIKSKSYQLIPNYIFVGMMMTAQIEYDGQKNLLSISLSHDDDFTTQYTLSAVVDIRNILPNMSTIGFSAATGRAMEQHQIFSWSFNSTLEVKQNSSASPPSSFTSSRNHKSKISVLVIGGIAAGTFVMFLLVGIILYHLRKRRSIKKTRGIEVIADESIDYEFEMGTGPKRFPYSELVDATNGFGVNEKLGEGGFGSVYKGILKDQYIHIAVKRVSKDSKQGKKEYISEVRIISQLRHRNLVQLIGWCHDHGEFLLVYELMYNGSLDNHLYSKERLLNWPVRHNIALGLGSALLYLHEEWEQCVVHRDIKPSNIMLDSQFNAKLGDFGLARLIDHNQDVETVAAGTKGYIAPECVLGTANASTHSDVFSFGVVLLEIACGRRPIMLEHDQMKVSLVHWVWDLYGQNDLMEAVDARLNGNYKKEEVERLMVVGLWCAHPEKSLRPSIRQAMNVLHFQAGLPILPPKMPVPVYAIPWDSNMQLHASSTATSSSIAKVSARSAPAPSSDSSSCL